MGSDSRERMLLSATHLLGRRGLHGTSFRDVIAHSGAPRGSIYHHFPRGKAQLIADTVRHIAHASAEESFEPGIDPVTMLWRVIHRWGELLRDSDYRAGCPLAAVVADGCDDDEEVKAAVSDVFAMAEWSIAYGLRKRGVAADRARRAASLLTASVEGAVMLCRAHRSLTALDDVGMELEAYLRALLGTAQPKAD
jgi:AcrR family transcriptional regulator